MLEHKSQPLLHRRAFLRRLGRSFLFGSGLILLSLVVGMVGFRLTGCDNWLDAFVNASMLLSGMGPVKPPQGTAGKLFAGLYALYSGLAVLVGAGIVFAPALHRLLHRLHLEEGDDGQHRRRVHNGPSC